MSFPDLQTIQVHFPQQNLEHQSTTLEEDHNKTLTIQVQSKNILLAGQTMTDMLQSTQIHVPFSSG